MTTVTPAALQQRAAQQEQQGSIPLGGAALARPSFAPLGGAGSAGVVRSELRRVTIPPHRMTPLRQDWENIMKPVVNHLKLQIRVNPQARCVEMKTSQFTTDVGALQRATDFVEAYMLGFDLQDAVALLRMEDLFVETFQVEDVKMLKGDHLSRAIGRVAGQGGKTKFAIENATRTRIVLADHKVHILGSFSNIKVARDAVCSLIMGAPPGKVYNHMRQVAGRLREKF